MKVGDIYKVGHATNYLNSNLRGCTFIIKDIEEREEETDEDGDIIDDGGIFYIVELINQGDSLRTPDMGYRMEWCEEYFEDCVQMYTKSHLPAWW